MDKYGAVSENPSQESTEEGPYVLQQDSNEEKDGLMRPKEEQSSAEHGEEEKMSTAELLYSTSSYYAIAKPVTLAMVLSAIVVVVVNNDTTRAQGREAMASAYEVWDINGGNAFALSLANTLVMVGFICLMTFGIVVLYHFRCMKCLIGYMMLSSGTLLGVLGGNVLQVAIQIYSVPVDKLSFYLFIVNFCLVGVAAIFFGQGIPKKVTQAYLIATSVILAWHLSYFDDWTAWTLLIMLALYDLCAVLTPCGPLKALVNLMSQDDSPDMPGLLFEADLPPEAKRPGVPRKTPRRESQEEATESHEDQMAQDTPVPSSPDNDSIAESQPAEDLTINIPLAIAKVYGLQIVGMPQESVEIMHPSRNGSASNEQTAAPLLANGDDSTVAVPDEPTSDQLQALVTVRLPPQGGRIELVARRGKKVYLERDRHGEPKRMLWVDKNGKVFAELRDDDEEAGDDRNSIRLGLGDFIFYSVLVAKAAQYSFTTFAACLLVILSGLGGTLVLLSVYHSALPALPISIFMGVFFYVMTRWFIEPWVEIVLSQPCYV